MPILGQRNYKNLTIQEILSRSDELVGKTIQELISREHSTFSPWQSVDEIRNLKKFNQGTGKLGTAVEELVFGMESDNRPGPDFTKAGVELKTTGLKKQKKKTGRGSVGALVAKERLTLGMIDYPSVLDETWERSSVIKKCSSLLLLFYVYEENFHCFDLTWDARTYIGKFMGLPEQFITQIEADWRSIVGKIRNGEAHLLSSGDTSFLEASRKGSSNEPLKTQPNSRLKAKKRAFSLKAEFVDHLYRLADANHEYDSSLRPEQTIEEFVEEKLSQIVGMTGETIAELQRGVFNHKNKQRWRQLVERQLAGGKKFSQLRELPMSNTELRVVNFESDLRLIESVSFPAFDYFEVAETPWENSKFFELLSTKRFLFACFQKSGHDNSGMRTAKFIGWQFWSFPMSFFEEARIVYQETQNRINRGTYKFSRKSESSVCHVRPHARNSKDLVEAPDGSQRKKYSFWLNANFIADELLGGGINESD